MKSECSRNRPIMDMTKKQRKEKGHLHVYVCKQNTNKKSCFSPVNVLSSSHFRYVGFFFLHEEKVVLHMFQSIINFFVIKTNPFSHSNQKVIYI